MDERRRLLPRSTDRDGSKSPVNIQVSGQDVNKVYWKMQVSCGLILLTVVLERLAFYGLSGNLVLFLNTKPFNWMSYHALSASFYFLGVSFMTSLFGGWLADSFLGRYKAILVSFFIYIIGYAMMPILSPRSSNDNNNLISNLGVCPVSNGNESSHRNNTGLHDPDNSSDPFIENCAWLIYLVLTVIAVGTGFVKANIAPFGADQVQVGGHQPTLVFFNWFYWSINIGAFIGLGIITYVEQQHSFLYGYLSCGVALTLGALLILFGGCVFIRKPASGSVLTNIFRIVREACKSRRRQSKIKSKTQRYIVDELDTVEEELHFLDYAKHRHGGIFHDSIVDDVRELKKILCVFLVLIPYWVVYFQMQTTFLLQGLHMRLKFNDSHPHLTDVCNITTNQSVEISKITSGQQPQIVAAWLSLFDVILLIIMLPLVDRVIYPKLAKAGYPFSMTKRIVFGMIFAIAAMVVAGVVESRRLALFWPSDDCPCVNVTVTQKIGNNVYNAADMSVLWQIPQYALIGMSEVFTSVAGLQYAVSMAPKSMKGIIMGLFYFTCGIGSVLGTGITSVLNANKIWFVDGNDHGDINCRPSCENPKDKHYLSSKSCHLDYYFYFLAAVEFIGMILFICVARWLRLDQEEINQTRLHLPVGEGNTGNGTSARRTTHSIQRLISNS